MFNLAELIAVLVKQNQGRMLKTISVRTTGEGIEVTGHTDDGEPFRIVSPWTPRAKLPPKPRRN